MDDADKSSNAALTTVSPAPVVYYNQHTRLAVVRCAREHCKLVESSLVFVTDLKNQDVKIRVARVCGT